MARWIVAAAALGVGSAVAGALLVFVNPSRDSVDVFVAARDLPANTQVADAIKLAPLSVPSTALLFTRRDAATLSALFTTHALSAGQLIQRSDVAPAPADIRLVFIPIKDMPTVAPGTRVDLLSVATDASGATSVQPFAVGITVRSSSSGGVVVAVSSRQAAAFVYGAAAMHLVVVVADSGTGPGLEAPVSSPDQAVAMAGQP